MTVGKHTGNKIRPIVLAGGLGTRLRPRTYDLPKPLLPVSGRPILWYALNSLLGTGMLRPIIAIDYKGELIRAFFERDNVEFRNLPNRTMAESVFEVAEEDSAEAFLGMSSDVLVPKRAVREVLSDFSKNEKHDTALFVELPKPGHKKWEFIVKDNCLNDINKKDTQTSFERVLLILTKRSLAKIRKILPKPITKDSVPDNLKPFQTGWILILKAMVLSGITVYSRIVDIPVCNINVPSDFDDAEKFVVKHMDRQ